MGCRAVPSGGHASGLDRGRRDARHVRGDPVLARWARPNAVSLQRGGLLDPADGRQRRHLGHDGARLVSVRLDGPGRRRGGRAGRLPRHHHVALRPARAVRRPRATGHAGQRARARPEVARRRRVGLQLQRRCQLHHQKWGARRRLRIGAPDPRARPQRRGWRADMGRRQLATLPALRLHDDPDRRARLSRRVSGRRPPRSRPLHRVPHRDGPLAGQGRSRPGVLPPLRRSVLAGSRRRVSRLRAACGCLARPVADDGRLGQPDRSQRLAHLHALRARGVRRAGRRGAVSCHRQRAPP